MTIPLKAGMKVLILNDDLRGNYKGKETIIMKKCTPGWQIYADGGLSWWPSTFLQVICCGAKGCMWHKKDSK